MDRLALLLCLSVFWSALVGAQQNVSPMPPLDLEDVSSIIRSVILGAEENVKALSESQVDDRELAFAYGQLGDALLVHGFIDPANVAYENAKLLEPNRLDWPYVMAVIAQEKGDVEASLRFLNAALELDPWDRASLIRRGRLYLGLGENESAEKDFQRVSQLDPESAAALAGLGEAALQQGDAAKAVEFLEQALRLQPQATRLYQPLGLAYRGAGRVDEARALMSTMGNRGDRDVVFLDPVMERVQEQSRSPQFYQESALAAAEAGDLAAARTMLVQALTLSPNDPLIVTNYGEVLAREGLLDQAREAFLQLIELKPNDPDAWFYLGQTEELLGRLEAATVAYQRLAELDDSDPRSKVGLAFVALAKGQYRNAEASFDALARSASDLEEQNNMRYWQAVALMGLEEYARADEVFKSLMEESGLRDRDVSMARARLHATVLGEGQNLDQALEWAEEVYDEMPDIESAATLAMVHARMGNFFEAQDYQAQAMFEALRDGALDGRDDLRQEMDWYRQEQAPNRPFGRAHPIFAHRRLN